MRSRNEPRTLIAMGLSVSIILVASFRPALAMTYRPDIRLGQVQERAANELADMNRQFQKQVRDRLAAEDEFDQKQTESQIAPIIAEKNTGRKSSAAVENSEELFLSAAAAIDPKNETSTP